MFSFLIMKKVFSIHFFDNEERTDDPCRSSQKTNLSHICNVVFFFVNLANVFIMKSCTFCNNRVATLVVTRFM